MVDLYKSDSGERYRLVLAPNCSIRWRELLIFYLFSCLLALVIGSFFALQGLWIVLPFSGVEMLVLGLGLYIVSRRTYRREVITVNASGVRVEKGVGHPQHCWEFRRPWIRLQDGLSNDFTRRRKLELGSHGEYVEVGEFLSNFEKDALAFQLKDCIIRA